ncbi:LysR family transcriptional regulator [uncultured Roseobacter sp.]|uniref:LysR family transcriptional regulator n=1 Tax=uncultured Roseobacter sp. TaxID=114847 RepID=UPI00263558E3|nr:LysR family transcriptional regulator [uncultured Roseobacter sp.]
MKTEIETQHLTYFLSVAETGSFRKAASRLNVGQPAVSRRIQRLEDILGVSLFERRSTGARLTTAGTCFAARARVIVDELRAATDTARGAGLGENGYLRIGVIASLSRGPLRQVLESFVDSHAYVDLCIAELDRGQLLTQLSHRRLDLVVAPGKPDHESGDGLILAHERVYLAVPSDHPLADRQGLRWSEVLKETFVVSTQEPGPEIHDYLVRNLSELGRTVQVRRHSMGREGIMSLVGLGFGVSLVADHWLGVRYRNVTFVPIGNDEEIVPFSMIWRPENDNPALRRFISLARIEAKRNGALS